MVASNATPDQLVAEARRIYDSELRAKLEPAENGKFLVLNVDTGEFELDADDMTASMRASRRFGDARLVTLRVGHRSTYRLGASMRRCD